MTFFHVFMSLSVKIVNKLSEMFFSEAQKYFFRGSYQVLRSQTLYFPFIFQQRVLYSVM